VLGARVSRPAAWRSVTACCNYSTTVSVRGESYGLLSLPGAIWGVDTWAVHWAPDEVKRCVGETPAVSCHAQPRWCRCLPFLALLAPHRGNALAESLETRYWHALNSGRDLSAMVETMSALTRASQQGQPTEALREQALKQLTEVEENEPLPAVVSKRLATPPRLGSN